MAIECHRNSGTHKKGWFSIAMLVYRRVILNLRFYQELCTWFVIFGFIWWILVPLQRQERTQWKPIRNLLFFGMPDGLCGIPTCKTFWDVVIDMVETDFPYTKRIMRNLFHSFFIFWFCERLILLGTLQCASNFQTVPRLQSDMTTNYWLLLGNWLEFRCSDMQG